WAGGAALSGGRGTYPVQNQLPTNHVQAPPASATEHHRRHVQPTASRSCAQHHLPSRRDKAQPAHVSPNVEIHKQGAPSVLTTPNAKATTSQTNPQPACDPPGKESPQNNQKILTATVVLVIPSARAISRSSGHFGAMLRRSLRGSRFRLLPKGAGQEVTIGAPHFWISGLGI